MNFNISAAVVRQLGEELVSDEVTAILELVKNSYDADATYTNVVIDTNAQNIDEFPNRKFQNGYVTIEDNGTGMDLNEIENGWLVISLSKKREMKAKGYKTEAGRVPLGDKGLGRLSTQRIGDRLDMITSKKGDSTKTVVSINWSQFDNEKLLTDVIVDLDELPNPKGTRGTKLVISDLRNPEVWLGNFRRTIQNKLSQLISPFEAVRTFKVYLTINGEQIQLFELANKLRDVALSTYSFSYDSCNKTLQVSGKLRLNKFTYKKSEELLYRRIITEDQGREFFSFLSNPSNKDSVSGINYMGKEGWFMSFEYTQELYTIPGLMYFTEDDQVEIYDPGYFDGEIDEFSLTDNTIITNVYDKISEYKEFVKQQVGIRIFRDGFGIRPYGYQGQDWLGLSRNQTSGGSFYGLRPSNVVGYINLTGDNNRELKEKTDREGFIENPYSQNFFILTETVRDRINNLLEGVRRSFITYRDIRSAEELNLGEQSLDESFATIKSSSNQLSKIDIQIDAASKAINDARKTVVLLSAREESKGYNHLLEEINKTLSEANNLVSQMKAISPEVIKLSKIALYLKPKIETIENQLTEFTELASLGLTTESLSHELVNVSNSLDLRTRSIDKILKNEAHRNKDFISYVEYIKTTVSSIRKQLSHLSPALKYQREGQEVISIKSFIDETINYYESSEQAVNIKFSINLNGNFDVKINKGKLTQIFDNLILNSIFWLKEYSKSQVNFIPYIHFEITHNSVIIWDNGIGIDVSVEQSIFQPFITTKPRGLGRGLGLFIVRQLLDSISSTIFLLPDRNSLDRRYKFELNFSNILHHV